MEWILFSFVVLQQLSHAFILGKWASKDTKPGEFFWWFAAVFQLELIATVILLSSIKGLTASGIAIIISLISTIIIGWQYRRQWREIPKISLFFSLKKNSPAFAIPAILIIGLIILKVFLPVHRFDDLSYHAPRAAYWIQNHSAQHFEANNDRNNAFPFGSEAWFFEGIALTRSEVAGQALHSFGIILLAIGFLALSRRLGAGDKPAIIAFSLFLVLPSVQFNLIAIKPEAWSTLSLLAILWYTDMMIASPAQWKRATIGVILWMCIGSSYRIFFVILGFPLAIVWIYKILKHRIPLTQFGRVWCTWVLLGLTSSGVLYTSVQNFKMYGHPLGPDVLRYIHQANISLEQVKVHAARTPFILLQGLHLPQNLNELVPKAMDKLAGVTGADTMLPWEHKLPWWWPGAFVAWPDNAMRHSYLGIPVIALLASLIVYLMSRKRGVIRMVHLGTCCFAVLSTLFYCSFIIGIFRWATMAGLPQRFLVAPVAVILLVTAVLASRIRFESIEKAGILVMCGWLIWPGIEFAYSEFTKLAKDKEEFYHHPASYQVDKTIPGNARILVLGSDPDYALFSPENGFSRIIIPWGKADISKSSMERALQRSRPDFVIFPQSRWVQTLFSSPLNMREAHEVLEALPYVNALEHIAHYRIYEIDWKSPGTPENFMPISPASTYTTRRYIHPVFGETLEFNNGWIFNKWVKFADFSKYPNILFPNSFGEQRYQKTDQNGSWWLESDQLGPIAINPEKYPIAYSADQDIWFMPLYDTIDARGFMDLQNRKPFVSE